MAHASSQDWNKGENSGLVSIGSHKLYVSVAGPDRKKDEPAIALMQGLDATIAEWVAVRPLVAPFARFLCYDRSGMGKSESYPEPLEAITAVAIAHELDTHLKTIKCGSPIHCVGDDRRAGNHVLYKEEFDVIEKENEDPRHQATQMAELGGFKTCFPVLAAKKQLENHAPGNNSVSVIHGSHTGQHFQSTYDAAIARDNGMEKDREEFRYLIKEWEENSGPRMKNILDLSTNTTLGVHREKERSGHNVQLTEPDLIV